MRLSVICVLVTIITLAAPAQTVTTGAGQRVITKTEGGKTMVRIEGGAFIPELGCALGDDAGHVKVIHAMPTANRPKAYGSIDVQANDLVLMVNAKPLKTAEAFRGLYDALAVGDTITLGIKRGEAMFLAPFVKMNPKDMPQGRQVIIKKKD